jgi:hypothetical protein
MRHHRWTQQQAPTPAGPWPVPSHASRMTGPHQSQAHHLSTLRTLRVHKPVDTRRQSGHRVRKVSSGVPECARARDALPVLSSTRQSGWQQAKWHCAIAPETTHQTATGPECLNRGFWYSGYVGRAFACGRSGLWMPHARNHAARTHGRLSPEDAGD